MARRKNTKVLVLEKNQEVIDLILPVLEKGPYDIRIINSSRTEVGEILREEPQALVLIGDIGGSGSTFELMKDTVRLSPMSSVILITDLPEEEVHEITEGYGILGHLKRTASPEMLMPLLESFEKIRRSLS